MKETLPTLVSLVNELAVGDVGEANGFSLVKELLKRSFCERE